MLKTVRLEPKTGQPYIFANFLLYIVGAKTLPGALGLWGGGGIGIKPYLGPSGLWGKGGIGILVLCMGY